MLPKKEEQPVEKEVLPRSRSALRARIYNEESRKDQLREIDANSIECRQRSLKAAEGDSAISFFDLPVIDAETKEKTKLTTKTLQNRLIMEKLDQ